MPTPLPIESTVEVDAPPHAVWAVVGDLLRMPELSPELRRLYVVGGGRPRVGSTLVGLNRRGLVAWPTTSTVTVLDEERAVAWRTRESGATWSYRLEALDEGRRTRLTGRRDLPAFTVGTTLLAPIIGGAEGHDRELAAGIAATLTRIKRVVEDSRPAAAAAVDPVER
ncbi:SRPBCC family protein [Nocardioides iriomotensis]|uniref:SRPBCC family protein n=1 Tax=Nocardioides iriomotensis TaxID=715784 RepID=UPI0013EA7C71|nr:SRPBCC family protein [Nocardioides iriomotensis]